MPADVYFGGGQTTLKHRERIKLETIETRRLRHRKSAAKSHKPDEPDPLSDQAVNCSIVPDDGQSSSLPSPEKLANIVKSGLNWRLRTFAKYSSLLAG